MRRVCVPARDQYGRRQDRIEIEETIPIDAKITALS
jgi:hypothetical protein